MEIWLKIEHQEFIRAASSYCSGERSLECSI